MNDSTKKALCEWPTERQKPTGTPLGVATWAMRWFGDAVGLVEQAFAGRLVGRVDRAGERGMPRSIQRGVIASPALVMRSVSGTPSASSAGAQHRDAARAVEVVRHVLLARPDQLHRPAAASRSAMRTAWPTKSTSRRRPKPPPR